MAVLSSKEGRRVRDWEVERRGGGRAEGSSRKSKGKEGLLKRGL